MLATGVAPDVWFGRFMLDVLPGAAPKVICVSSWTQTSDFLYQKAYQITHSTAEAGNYPWRPKQVFVLGYKHTI